MTDLERIIYILNTVPLYRKYTIYNMVNTILPAVKSNQYVIVSNNKTPLFFGTWSFLSQKVSDEYAAGIRELQAEDWNTGVIPWIIDCVAPYGGVFAELRNKESQSVKALKAAGVKGKIQYFRQKGKKRTLQYATLL